MKARVQTTMGKSTVTFEIEERSDMETLHRVAVLGYPPIFCDACQTSGAEHFTLDSNKDKAGNIYVNVKCRKCGAKAKLGQYKAGGYFWHKFSVYKKENGHASSEDIGDGNGE